MTRQAYYQDRLSGICTGTCERLVLKEVLSIRRDHSRMGGRKLYAMLEPFLVCHGIKMGRDGFFDLLSANGLLVRRVRRGTLTTDSHHWLRKYPNLIRDYVPTVPDQLWVSDITYWKVGTGYTYISFVTDAYSRKIVGHHVSGSLEAIGSIAALDMALSGLPAPLQPGQLTHHSDRGVQYCSQGYVKLLQAHGVRISMTENGDPLENAIAERVNGIMKGEYLDPSCPTDLGEAARILDAAVALYNGQRPHSSISNLTPDHVHDGRVQGTERLWRNYYKPSIGHVENP